MSKKTPCEKKGLREGQWVWATGRYSTLDRGWVQLVKDDGTSFPFWSESSSYNNPSCYLGGIDFTQGIHDEKPNWTPRAYGGEGPPGSGVKESLTTDDPRDPEFWKDAPEGATHWIPPSPASSDVDKGVFAKKVDGQWMGWAGTRWKAIPDADGRKFGKDVERVAIPRPEPEQPDWRGPEDGLPPVGTVCEAYDYGQQDWARVEVLKHGKSVHPVVRVDHRSTLFWAHNFRPIRTERERVIDEYLRRQGYIGDLRGTDTRDALENAYDAGWLRPPESDKE